MHRERCAKKVKQERTRDLRDCQNVAGGNVSGEVEKSQTEREQAVETIISVCESPRAGPA